MNKLMSNIHKHVVFKEQMQSDLGRCGNWDERPNFLQLLLSHIGGGVNFQGKKLYKYGQGALALSRCKVWACICLRGPISLTNEVGLIVKK